MPLHGQRRGGRLPERVARIGNHSGVRAGIGDVERLRESTKGSDGDHVSRR